MTGLMPRNEAANAVTVGDLSHYHLRRRRETKSVETLSPVAKQPVIREGLSSRWRVKQAQDEVGAMGRHPYSVGLAGGLS